MKSVGLVCGIAGLIELSPVIARVSKGKVGVQGQPLHGFVEIRPLDAVPGACATGFGGTCIAAEYQLRSRMQVPERQGGFQAIDGLGAKTRFRTPRPHQPVSAQLWSKVITGYLIGVYGRGYAACIIGMIAPAAVKIKFSAAPRS